MTAAAIAQLLDARPSGRGSWKARCPAHPSRSRSLSIREGNRGKTLILCRAGCNTRDVLAAAGLRMSDLFPGPPPSPVEAREAAEERERSERKAQAHRRKRGSLADQYRTLNDLVHAIAARLHQMPDGEEGDKLAIVFHRVIDKVHTIETIFEQQELQEFDRRVVRVRERHLLPASDGVRGICRTT